MLEMLSDGLKGFGCFADRAYLKINGKRFKRTSTSDIIDNILQENIDKEIAISTRHTCLFGNVIYSVKEENGEVTKIGIANLIIMTLLRVVVWLIPFVTAVFISAFAGGGFRYIPYVICLFPLVSLIRDNTCRNQLK